MKAEQRKGLETNTLADRMGHMMQRVKTSQRRTVVLYFLAGAVLVLGLWFGYRWWDGLKQDTSLQWLILFDGNVNGLQELATKDSKNTPAGKAARLQIAWLFYWDLGVKSAAADQKSAMASLKQAAEWYGKLAEDCKDDENPVFAQQALLGLAVTRESLAIENPTNLKRAAEHYKDLVEKYKNSAEAKFAKERLEVLDDATKKKTLEASYGQLRQLFGIPAFQQQRPDDDFHKFFDKK